MVLVLVLPLIGLWLCTGFYQSWSWYCQTLVLFRLPSVLVLPLLGYGCEQAFSSLEFDFAGLWF